MASARDREFEKFIDKSDEYQNTYADFTVNGVPHVMITQKGETDGAQVLVRRGERGWEAVDTDTLVDVAQPSAERAELEAAVPCVASSDDDHRKVHEVIVDQVDKFSSESGPDGGNLACVWAVRHLARRALDRWITRTDGTAVFDPELKRCPGPSTSDGDIPAGGIIISPTVPGNVGHVGLFGPPTGNGSRLIYSNSSAAAMWKQNFTLDSWIARYKVRKGLKVHFYRLPNKTGTS